MEMHIDNPAMAGRRRGVSRMKRHSVKTDMTPMVDLGFLLITFFVMTIKMSEPVVDRLNMPKDGPPMPVKMSNALTVLLDKENTIYYYHGDLETALAKNEIKKTSFDARNGIGKVIREKQQTLDHLRRSDSTLEGRKGLMLLIKASSQASYSNIIDLLDETTINNVGKYALLKLDKKELDHISKVQ